MEMPLVSILINNFNYARFLRAAVDSALAQTYPHVEIIVVDDGSTDESLSILAEYGDRIRTVGKTNGGQASTFNAGFAASRGEIACFLDADDLFRPEKVAALVETFTAMPEIGWCFDQIVEFDSDTGATLPRRFACRPGRWDERSSIVTGIAASVPTATSGLSFRRSCLVQILPMPEAIRITSDNYLKLTALHLAPGWFICDELTRQRIHGTNAYTLVKKGKNRIIGEVSILTGLALHQHFPKLERLGMKIFANGLGTLWVTGGVPPTMKSSVGNYLRLFPLKIKAELGARALYWGAKRLLS